MDDTDYFTVEGTACVIQKRGAMAIYCGDKTKHNADGTRSFSLRGPLLLMPPDMWSDGDETLRLIVKLLNDNAHLFFDSAKKEQT